MKCASHSSREICPSPFLSTDEKLGVCELAPLEAPAFGALEAPPAALSEDLLSVAPALEPEDLLSLAAALEPEDLLSVAPVLGEPVLCACATPASARSAAAVAVPTTLNNMEIPPRRGLGRLQRQQCNEHACGVASAESFTFWSQAALNACAYKTDARPRSEIERGCFFL